jgi:predicted RNA-binding Zn-ribbon protein involved in translation (DUF1610 family)
MTEKLSSFRCAECGDTVVLRSGPGRFEKNPGGISVQIPSDFEIPTCPTCGERYFTVELGEALSRVLSETR